VAHVTGKGPGADDLAQQGGQQFVGAGRAPGAADVGVEPVQQAGAPGPVASFQPVEDEAGVVEHG
jgi:hypothetical protein